MSVGSRSERILITGGTGFTGRPLVQRLLGEGHDVLALGHDPDNAKTSSFDLRNFESVKRILSQFRPDVVVHLAGIAATTHDKLDEIYSANVIGTVNLFAALRSLNIPPRLAIMASSAQIYSSVGPEVQLSEESPLGPKTHYAVSKHAAEEVAAIYARDFPILVCRPFNYTGPGQSTAFLVPKIVQHYVEQRREIKLGNLDLYRDLSDVDRVVEAYSRLISRSLASGIVNICSGRLIHLADIITIMDDISGYNMNVVTDPALLRADEPRSLVGSPARLESIVGTLPNPELRETLVRMYEHGRKVADGIDVRGRSVTNN